MAVALLLAGAGSLKAQRQALRANLLGWATANFNVEYSRIISEKLTVGVVLQAKPFSYPLPAPIGFLHRIEGRTSENEKIASFGTIKHTENYTIQPSIRYWGSAPYDRWFVGLHGVATKFKYGGDRLDPTYLDGMGFGLGASAGWSFYLSRKFNLEAELGIGFLARNYKEVYEDGSKSGSKSDVIPSLTRLGVSLVYLF